MASLQPTPFNATYGATKSFVTSFSESLHEELRTSGVQVTAVLPGFTRTGFQEHTGVNESGGMPDFVWQSAEAVACFGETPFVRVGRAPKLALIYRAAEAVTTRHLKAANGSGDRRRKKQKQARTRSRWVPACAGMTAYKKAPRCGAFFQLW